MPLLQVLVSQRLVQPALDSPLRARSERPAPGPEQPEPELAARSAPAATVEPTFAAPGQAMPAQWLQPSPI